MKGSKQPPRSFSNNPLKTQYSTFGLLCGVRGTIVSFGENLSHVLKKSLKTPYGEFLGKIDIVDLNFDEVVEVKPPFQNVIKTFLLPKTVKDCDVFIDVPVLKVTNSIGFSCAMKNMVGIAPGMKYGWAKTLGFPPGVGQGLPGHTDMLSDEMIVDLTSIARINLVVVDAIVGMERGRVESTEEGGSHKRLNTIIAGADPVSVDAVCTRLVGFNPDDFEFLTLADRQGLGTADLSKLTLKGQPFEEILTRFEKKPSEDWDQRAHYGQSNRIWILKGPFPIKDENRWRPDPKTIRPLPGVDDWSKPFYFQDDFINLKAYYGRDKRDVVAYAYTEFDAPKAQDAELWTGSDGGLTIWLNGEKVYNNTKIRRAELPNDVVPVKIMQGTNRLLCEVSRTGRDFVFCLNICEPEKDSRYNGNRILGLKFTIPEVTTALTAASTVDSSNVDEGMGALYFLEWKTKDKFPGAVVRSFALADSLPEGWCNGLVQAPDGSIWGVVQRSIVQYDGKRWRTKVIKNGPKDWVYSMFLDSKGHIWLTGDQLIEIVGDSATSHPIRWCSSIAEGPDGAIYTGSWDGDESLKVLRDGTWSNVDLGQAKPKSGSRATVSVDSKGVLYIGLGGRGLIVKSGDKITRYTTTKGLGDNHVTEILFGPKGQIYVTFDDSGISWYDGKKWHYFNPENGLPGDNIYSAALDKTGKLWVIVDGENLAQFDGKRWAVVTCSKMISKILVDRDNNLWLGGRGGISIFSQTASESK